MDESDKPASRDQRWNGGNAGSKGDSSMLSTTAFERDSALAITGNHSTIDQLDSKLVQAVSERGVVRDYPKNMIIINEGDRNDLIFFVLSGQVKVYLTGEDGKEMILVKHGAGEYFGELALDGSPRSASVATTEPTKLAILKGSELKSLVTDQPDLAMHLIMKLIRIARYSTETIRDLALTDVYHRLVKYLMRIATPEGDRLVINPKPTQEEIAKNIAASRDMVTKILKQLAIGNYIVSEGKAFVILKRPPAAW